MSYAVYHTEKGKSGSGGIGNHIDRVEGMEHTYQHADPNRKNLNVNFAVPKEREKMKLSDAINDRIKEGYNGKRKIRTDAVKFQTHILTGSHEKMKEIFANQTKAKEWINENFKWVAKEFGKENIVRFALHLDEKTPHIHAVTVPLTPDGRLSVNEIIGNKKAMQERQDRYAEAMKPFGLERGMKNTGIKHENAQEYYKRINQANEIGEKDEIKASKNVLGVYTSESVQNLENTLKSQKTALKSKELELEKEKEKMKVVAGRNNILQKNLNNTTANMRYALVSDEGREKVKAYESEQIGKKYSRQLESFISHDFQKKSKKEIADYVLQRAEKIGQKEKLSKADIILLKQSPAVQQEFERILKKVQHWNEIDQHRSRGRGR